MHAEVSAWLSRQAETMTRLPSYLDRLDRAAAAIDDGDGRFVASPMLDSYHTVWFELHELLIRLAGRTRAEETEAGRA